MYSIEKIENACILPADVLKKDGTIKVRFYDVLYDLADDISANRKSAIYHYKRFTGSYKHLQLDDTKHEKMLYILRCLGVSFETGNDAPRGGVSGDYIKINYDYRNKYIKAIKNTIKK